MEGLLASVVVVFVYFVFNPHLHQCFVVYFSIFILALVLMYLYYSHWPWFDEALLFILHMLFLCTITLFCDLLFFQVACYIA